MTGDVHAQADLAGFPVFFYQPVVGIAKLPRELFIMLRAVPGRVFAFGFCRMFPASAAGQFFYRGDKETVLFSGINLLPEPDLLIRRKR